MKPCLPKAYSCLSCLVDITLGLRYNINRLKLTAQVKLVVSPEQSDALKRTMQAANAVCDSISAWAWENQVFGQYPLHKAQYAAQRAMSGLTAQVIVRCVGKVADAYKLDKRTQRTFQPTGAIAFDDRILNWYVEREQVSIWSVDGRLKLPFVCGDYQRGLLAFRQGEADLVLVNGDFYLLATCNISDPPIIETNGVLGVDMGLVNIAVDSEGNRYSGSECRSYRRRKHELRRGLQSCGTKSAKRHLKAIRRKESNYQRWVNHNVSKQIVQTAVNSCKAIAIESLKGIGQRASAFSREMRRELGSWAFAQLGGFIQYKAVRKGVPTVQIDPRNTSRECSCCGHIDKANRRSQSKFLCLKCGHQANADDNASANIERRGLMTRGIVNCPKVATVTG